MSYTYEQLYTRVAKMLGTYRPGDATPIRAEDLAQAKEVVASGYQRFLTHRRWNFLEVSTSVSTTAAQDYVQLPTNFREMVGTFTYSSAVGYQPLIERTRQDLMKFNSQGVSSGFPVMWALNADTFSAAAVTGPPAIAAGQRWKALLYPIPDATYSLYYTYRMNVDALSATTDIHIGGDEMQEAVLACCLARAELEIDENNGVYEKLATSALTKAVEIDAEKSASTLGSSVGFRRSRGPFNYLNDQPMPFMNHVTY